MAGLRLLVVEGNTAERNAQIHAQGGEVYADLYSRVLKAISPGAACKVVRPCETGFPELRGQIDPAALDGVVWTGSSLNAYDGRVEVRRQIDLFGELFDTRLPIFGSCWGLQVMTVAMGGVVRRNPRGREIGVARDIAVNAAGAAHPMFRGKPSQFDALATHVDEVARLPDGGEILAGNTASAIQAATLERDGRSFWGVQYHPEFDFGVLAQVLRRGGRDLVEEGFFASPDALEDACQSLVAIGQRQCGAHLTPAIPGISDDLADDAARRTEISNWISFVDDRRRPRADTVG